MKTIAELNKERLTIRTTNPVRAKALMMLIDGATKKAKSENREVTEQDILETAKMFASQATKDINEIKEKRIKFNITTPVDFSSYEEDIKFYKEFLPAEVEPLSVEEMKAVLASTGIELVKSNRGRISGAVKNIPRVNMKEMANLLNEILT